MILIKKIEDKKVFLYNDKKIFLHSKSQPFIEILNEKLEFKSSRGSCEVKQKLIPQRTLPEFDYLQINDGYQLTFSNGLEKITVFAKENENGFSLFPTSENKFDRIIFNFFGDEKEEIFGGGEQFRQLNMKGEKIKNLVSEHIVVKPIIQKTIGLGKIFGKEYKPKKHSEIKTYAPMSTYFSSNHYAIKIDVSSYGEADFSNKNVNKFSYSELPKSINYIFGETYKDISLGLASIAKPKQFLPSWANEGMILATQGGIDYAIKRVDEMLERGAKVSGVWCQDWSGKNVTLVGKQVYWNWEYSREEYPDLPQKIEYLKNKGVHFVAYINPYLIVNGKMYNYCKEKDMLIKNRNGEIYEIKSTTFPAGMMDLTNPDMVKYLKDIIIRKNMLDIGIDSYMADFGEYLPHDAVLKNGNAMTLHNEWPTIWAKINREAIRESGREREVFFFTRSAYNDAQKYSAIMWNGDQHTDYSLDYGLPCTMPAAINLGLSGLPLSHSDIGGYITFKSLKRDNELYIRWMEMNTFTPLMRTHETVRPDENAQFHSEGVVEYTVRLSNVHHIIKPYIDFCINETRKGLPAMRAPFYEYNDIALHKEDYVFMLGSDIFVAPVIKAGEKSRTAFVPQGNWTNIFTGEKAVGNREITVDTPLGQPFVFYKNESEYKEIFEKVKEYYKNN